MGGKLIVIEGTDGSGKSVQTKLLVARLRKTGHRVATLSFPQYGEKSAGLVEEYLNGKYGKAGAVDPYTASLFFALDRFDASYKIKKLLTRGFTVVLDRYVDSNAAHQGGKIKNPVAREKFIRWLCDLEYRILGIPKQDRTIVLHVPVKISQRLILKKNVRGYLEGKKRRDSHERDLSHLKAAEHTYLWLTKKNSRTHKVVECAPHGNLLPPEEISNHVWKTLHT